MYRSLGYVSFMLQFIFIPSIYNSYSLLLCVLNFIFFFFFIFSSLLVRADWHSTIVHFTVKFGIQYVSFTPVDLIHLFHHFTPYLGNQIQKHAFSIHFLGFVLWYLYLCSITGSYGPLNWFASAWFIFMLVLLYYNYSGPLPVSEDGYTYVRTYLDFYTKFVDFFPPKNKSALGVTKCMSFIHTQIIIIAPNFM